MMNITTYGSASFFTKEVIAKLDETEKADIGKWEITFSDGMPVLGVPRIRDDNEQLGYLMPFRAYRFQVCGNMNGEWDLGSSDVMPDMFQLAHLGELGFKCLRALALDALHHYGAEVGVNNVDAFDAFICLCADYLRKRTEHIKQCYHIA
jgi:hypothetical protein